MPLLIIAAGLAIIGMGAFGLRSMGGDEGFAMLHGCLTLGGALVIAAAFAFRMRPHGIIGAGVVALLGASRGLSNLPGLAAFLAGERDRGPAPLIEFAVTLLCLIVLVHAVRWLLRERIKRMLENNP